MITEKNRIKGMVTVTVRDSNGNIKWRKANLLQRIFGIKEVPVIFKHHNTITNQGDGLIADLMTSNPTQNKVDSTNGYMLVGTGWTGSSPKSNTTVNTKTGPYKKLDTGFPKLQGAFGEDGQNVVLYRSTFTAGDLAANGINEVALLNGLTSDAKCLAYAQITPSVNVTASDTLQIDWQINFLGK